MEFFLFLLTLKSILKCLVSIIIHKNGLTFFKITRANMHGGGGGGGGSGQFGQKPTFLLLFF